MRTVHVEDGVQASLEMLPILPRARQAELLAAELEAQGFVRDGAVARRVDRDGLEITVDLEAVTVTVRIGADAHIEETIERTGSVVDDRGPGEHALRERVKSDLEDRVTERTEALRKQITQRLEQKLGDLRTELDGAVGRATVAALTEKAASLGQIESVVADEAGNVAIKVKL